MVLPRSIIGTNIIDVFITNRPSVINSCASIDGISDHEAVLIKPAAAITVQLCHLAKRVSYLHSTYGLRQILIS